MNRTKKAALPCPGKEGMPENRDSPDVQELLSLYKKTGDPDLKWEIVLRYSDLVKKVAAQTRGLFNSFAQTDDIIQEGILVLLNAVDKFDPSKGIKFETYIAKRLRGMVIDLARKQDWVPRQIRQKAVKLNRAEEELSRELGCAPSGQKMAEHLGMTMEEYEELRSQAAASSLMSFEALLDACGGTPSGDRVPTDEEWERPEEVCQEKELHQILAEGIASLRENEQLVLSLYYEKELTMKEIAQVLGVSAPRVSQIHSCAIEHLRTIMEQYIET